MTRISGTGAPAIELHDAPEHLSYSQLTMLHPAYKYACARKWAYRYRLKLPDERGPSLAVGSALDDAANYYFRARMRGDHELGAFMRAGDVGVSRMREEHESVWGGRLDEYECLFTMAFAALVESEGKRQVAAVQDKHTFTVRISEDHVLPILGYSDRVDADGTLVDHKFSGSPRWAKEEAGKPLDWHTDYVNEKRDQLLLYWLARNAEEKRLGQPLDPPLNGAGRLVVVYHKVGLVKPQLQVKELRLDLEEGGRDLLHRIAEAAWTLREGRLPARPGDACRFCAYLARCRDDEAARGRSWMDVTEVPF